MANDLKRKVAKLKNILAALDDLDGPEDEDEAEGPVNEPPEPVGPEDDILGDIPIEPEVGGEGKEVTVEDGDVTISITGARQEQLNQKRAAYVKKALRRLSRNEYILNNVPGVKIIATKNGYVITSNRKGIGKANTLVNAATVAFRFASQQKKAAKAAQEQARLLAKKKALEAQRQKTLAARKVQADALKRCASALEELDEDEKDITGGEDTSLDLDADKGEDNITVGMNDFDKPDEVINDMRDDLDALDDMVNDEDEDEEGNEPANEPPSEHSSKRKRVRSKHRKNAKDAPAYLSTDGPNSYTEVRMGGGDPQDNLDGETGVTGPLPEDSYTDVSSNYSEMDGKPKTGPETARSASATRVLKAPRLASSHRSASVASDITAALC
jgi:hypothetical protein